MTNKKKLLEWISVHNKPCKFVGDTIIKSAVDFNELADFILKSDNDESQSTFAIGEYYTAEYNDVLRIYRIEKYNVPDRRSISVKVLLAETGEICNWNWGIGQIMNDKPATTEQIKEFKLAKAIANTGQSADQIRQMLSNGKMPMGPWLELQKTAEELQEVNKS